MAIIVYTNEIKVIMMNNDNLNYYGEFRNAENAKNTKQSYDTHNRYVSSRALHTHSLKLIEKNSPISNRDL